MDVNRITGTKGSAKGTVNKKGKKSAENIAKAMGSNKKSSKKK